MKIREATILDHSEITRSIIKQIEGRITNYPPANKSVAVWVTNVLVHGYVLVAEYEGRIVGTIGMGMTHFPWNDEVWILNNDWLHVEEGYRSNDVASKMIQKVKEFADTKRIVARFDVINDQNVDKIDRFLQIKGLRYMGGNFIYGLSEL